MHRHRSSFLLSIRINVLPNPMVLDRDVLGSLAEYRIESQVLETTVF